jgi:hypothetical protein
MTERTLPQDDLEYNGWTTLTQIREHGPCKDGWQKLLTHLGKKQADNDPLHIGTILESNGYDDALWCLRAKSLDRLSRHFQAWCADQVLHVFEQERPDDARVRDQIAMLRNDAASNKQRAAARFAAWATAWATAGAAQEQQFRVMISLKKGQPALIRAAPDMLEALHQIADIEPDPDNMGRFHDIALAAIAKAEGKQ